MSILQFLNSSFFKFLFVLINFPSQYELVILKEFSLKSNSVILLLYFIPDITHIIECSSKRKLEMSNFKFILFLLSLFLSPRLFSSSYSFTSLSSFSNKQCITEAEMISSLLFSLRQLSLLLFISERLILLLLFPA